MLFIDVGLHDDFSIIMLEFLTLMNPQYRLRHTWWSWVCRIGIRSHPSLAVLCITGEQLLWAEFRSLPCLTSIRRLEDRRRQGEGSQGIPFPFPLCLGHTSASSPAREGCPGHSFLDSLGLGALPTLTLLSVLCCSCLW